jgi:hypothetical protein
VDVAASATATSNSASVSNLLAPRPPTTTSKLANTRVEYVIGAPVGFVNCNTNVALSPGDSAASLPTSTSTKGMPDGAAQFVTPDPLASVAVLLSESSVTAIGPDTVVAPVLRSVICCRYRPVAR